MVLRIEIDISKIRRNTEFLVSKLQSKNISVTGVVKAVLGMPEILKAMIDGGCRYLGDSKIENLITLNRDKFDVPMMLIRTPNLSQINQVIDYADISFNSEIVIISALSKRAEQVKKKHDIILMIELGDLREGVLPENALNMICEIKKLSNINLLGIGTNLTCRSGVVPDALNMKSLSHLAERIELQYGEKVHIISGGNSASLPYIFESETVGEINNIRIGESILLGRDTVTNQPIKSLFQDAFKLYVEIIESKKKLSKPYGVVSKAAQTIKFSLNKSKYTNQSILSVGSFDTDPTGLIAPKGYAIIGATSDHLIVSGRKLEEIGTELSFDLSYNALSRAMISPYVKKVLINNQ